MAKHIDEVIASFRNQYDDDVVCAQRDISSQAGQRITHLAVDAAVAHAWVAVTGEPFRPHHATALMSMRRGEAAMLVAAHPRRLLSMLCMLANNLIDIPGSRALLLVADDASAQIVAHEATRLMQAIPDSDIDVAVVTTQSHDMPRARVIVATYDALHRRLLRFHDRAWRLFWETLRSVGLVDLHMAAGIGMSHIAAMLVRMQRIVNRYSAAHVLQWLATSVPASEGLDAALQSLGVGDWRVIAADDYPSDQVHVEIWHAPEELIAIAHAAVTHVSAAGYTAHLFVRDVERHTVPSLADAQRVTMSAQLLPAHVLVVVGIADERWLLAEAYRAGYHHVLVLLSAHPLDSWYSQVPTRLFDNLQHDWHQTAVNAYVLTQHLRTAAYEWPLQADEVEAWHASELRDRLLDRQQLRALPQDQGWVSAGEDDPYDDFHIGSAIGLPVLMQIGDITLDAPFDPTGFERWLAKGAAVPPWYGGLRVTQRHDDDGSVTLQPDVPQRRTLPLRSCDVAIRDTKSTYPLANGITAAYGRVVVTERVVGMREIRDDVVRDHRFSTPLESRWSAPAWWVDVPQCSDDAALCIGWSIALVLPVLSMGKSAAVVPCGDTTFRRVYVVDAQPGGNGATEWMFAHLDDVLVTAIALAQTLQADPLLAQFCTLDNEWLRRIVAPRNLAQLSDALPSVLPMPAPQRTTAPASVVSTPVQADTHIEMASSTPAQPNDVTAPTHYGVTDSRSSVSRRTSSTRPRRGVAKYTPPARAVPARTSDTPTPPVARADTGTPPADGGAVPNVNRIMANIRKRIQQQLPASRAQTSGGTRTGTSRSDSDTRRFQPGQRVFCLPYGDGDVIDSELVDGREYIRVEFPTYGELRIDATVNLVRLSDDKSTVHDDEGV